MFISEGASRELVLLELLRLAQGVLNGGPAVGTLTPYNNLTDSFRARTPHGWERVFMFHVGPHSYTVRIAEKPIVTKGRRRAAECREGERCIVLSPTVKPHDRRNVLHHELFHLWMFHTGKPADGDVEAWCDLHATAAEQFAKDLAACGGAVALERLRPGQRLGHTDARIPLTRDRYCGVCQGFIDPREDITCTPVDGYAAPAVRLDAKCPHCDATWWQVEMATAGGYPSGVKLDWKGREDAA